MKYGCFGVMVKRALPPEEQKILNRFATEFERTYTRFLDLQKAEAQAREARIEAALERVRSRAMAMQNTEELLDAADLVGRELWTKRNKKRPIIVSIPWMVKSFPLPLLFRILKRR